MCDERNTRNCYPPSATRTGGPFALPAEFWSKTTPGENGCVEWIGAHNRDGYGNFAFEGATWLAHRLAYTASYGATDLNVLHRCDNPACVNADHLFAGTQADNVADCMAKERRASQAGENNGRAKLTSSDVAAIRAAYAAGGVSQSELARQFGVTSVTVNMIVRRLTWRDAA